MYMLLYGGEYAPVLSWRNELLPFSCSLGSLLERWLLQWDLITQYEMTTETPPSFPIFEKNYSSVYLFLYFHFPSSSEVSIQKCTVLSSGRWAICRTNNFKSMNCLLFVHIIFVFCTHRLATFVINDNTKIFESLYNFLVSGRWKIQTSYIYVMHSHYIYVPFLMTSTIWRFFCRVFLSFLSFFCI